MPTPGLHPSGGGATVDLSDVEGRLDDLEAAQEVGPLAVPGLVAWFAARHHQNLADGATVLTMPDLSGNGRALRQPTEGVRCTYETNEANALPVYRFVGASSQRMAAMTATQWDFLHQGSRTAIAVFRVPTMPASFAMLWDSGRGSTSNVGDFMGIYSDGKVDSTLTKGGGALIAPACVSAAGVITTTPYNVLVSRYTYNKTGNDLELFVNNVLVGSTNTTNDPPATAGTFIFTMGAQGSGGAAYLTMDLAEAQFYNRSLSDAEINELVGSLETTFGL